MIAEGVPGQLTDGAVATSGYGSQIIDPRTGAAARGAGPAAVTGPALSGADGLTTALYAAGQAGLSWFPTSDGYRALVLDGRAVPEPVTLR